MIELLRRLEFTGAQRLVELPRNLQITASIDADDHPLRRELGREYGFQLRIRNTVVLDRDVEREREAYGMVLRTARRNLADYIYRDVRQKAANIRSLLSEAKIYEALEELERLEMSIRV